MIVDYKDHAANERTYLAWVRTGITIMTLGFFIEKFDIYLAKLHATATATAGQADPDFGIHIVSILLVVLGVTMLAAGTWRFASVKRKLESDRAETYTGLRFVLILSGALGLFSVVLLLYLLRII